jgi:hypothetical protein
MSAEHRDWTQIIVLVIAVATLIVAYLTYRDTRETYRPILKVNEATAVPYRPLEPGAHLERGPYLKMSIENIGQNAATGLAINIDPGGRKDPLEFANPTTLESHMRTILGKGITSNDAGAIQILDGTITYADRASGKTYREPWCLTNAGSNDHFFVCPEGIR